MPEVVDDSPVLIQIRTAAATAVGPERFLLEKIYELLAARPETLLKLRPVPDGEEILSAEKDFKTNAVLVEGKAIIRFPGREDIITVDAPYVFGELAGQARVQTANATAKGDAVLIDIPGELYTEAWNAGKTREEIAQIHSGAQQKLTSVLNPQPGKHEGSELALLEQCAESAHGPEQEFIRAACAFLRDNPTDAEQVRTFSIAANTPLITEGGGHHSCCFVVLSGSADVYKRSSTSLLYLGSSKPGNLIGENTVNPLNVVPSSIITAEPMTTLVLPSYVMRRLLHVPSCKAALEELRNHRLEKQRDILAPAERTFGVKPRPEERTAADLENIREVLEGFSAGTGEADIKIFIDHFNVSEQPLTSHCWTLMARYPDLGSIVMINKNGVLQYVPLTAKNARTTLGLVKSMDEGEGYEIRMECIRRSNGKIDTMEAMDAINTMDGMNRQMVPPKGSPEYWGSLSAESTLIDERKILHRKIEDQAYARAVELSDKVSAGLEKLGLPGPALIVMKGNTGAGKSTSLRSGISFLSELNLLDEEGRLMGVLNPDDMKVSLRGEAKLGDKHTITHGQVLHEGTIINNRVLSRLTAEHHNIVMDKRLCRKSEMERDALRIAKESGYKTLIVLDVDAEFETSNDRVHGNPEKGLKGRSVLGDDPLVPSKEILNGFTGTRSDRAAIIDLLQRENSDPNGVHCHYLLLKTDGQKKKEGGYVPPTLVASMRGTDTVAIEAGAEELYTRCTTGLTEVEIARLSVIAKETPKRPRMS